MAVITDCTLTLDVFLSGSGAVEVLTSEDGAVGFEDGAVSVVSTWNTIL
jgi:hypothetical protein